MIHTATARAGMAAALLGAALALAQGASPAAHAGSPVLPIGAINAVSRALAPQAATTQWVNQAAPWSSFAPIADGYFAQGLRAVSIATTVGPDGQVLYSAVFHSEQGTGAQWITPAQDAPTFGRTVDYYAGQGLRLVSTSAVTNPGQFKTPLFTGVFRGGQGADAQLLDGGRTYSAVIGRIRAHHAEGLRLVSLSTNVDNYGQIYYGGVFRAGQGHDGEAVSLGNAWEGFAADDARYFGLGYRLVSISTATGTDGRVRYSGVYRDGQGSGAQYILSARGWADFAAADKGYFDQGLRLVSLGLTTDAQGTVLYTGAWRGL